MGVKSPGLGRVTHPLDALIPLSDRQVTGLPLVPQGITLGLGPFAAAVGIDPGAPEVEAHLSSVSGLIPL